MYRKKQFTLSIKESSKDAVGPFRQATEESKKLSDDSKMAAAKKEPMTAAPKISLQKI